MARLLLLLCKACLHILQLLLQLQHSQLCSLPFGLAGS
jgi:hypothetical protein